MERVLIVARTRMTAKLACVGALTHDTFKGIRLLRPNHANQPANTPFQVGQIWDIHFYPCPEITPPHVEDVIVTAQKLVGQHADLHSLLLHSVNPWKGGVAALFDGLLHIDTTSYCISRSVGIPHCSTGYWLPDQPLILTERNSRAYYQIEATAEADKETLKKYHRDARKTRGNAVAYIPFVGCAEPIPLIEPGTLVRVSLSRWWRQEEFYEKKCYLQLSGWYR
jgi:hypothetical protein